MYRLKEDTMAELEIKKSRFLCYLHKSFSEADAKEFIQQIKKLHPKMCIRDRYMKWCTIT